VVAALEIGKRPRMNGENVVASSLVERPLSTALFDRPALEMAQDLGI